MKVFDWNSGIIAEFRKSHGVVGGHFKGQPLLLLHTTGAKTGKARVNPLGYLKDGERYIIFASKSGSDSNPDWYYNLKAHPDVQIEVGDDTIDVRAEAVHGPEHDRSYGAQAKLFPGYGDYLRKTKRVIPLIALTRK